MKKALVFIEIYLTIATPTIFFSATLLLIIILGEYPTPLPSSEKPKKLLLEVGVYTLIIILFLTLNIFVLNPIGVPFYILLVLSTIMFLLIPLIYTRYKDHWTSKDLGINFKVKSRGVVIVGLIAYTWFGFLNSFALDISWYLLLIFFYSNAFLEEFLFRGIIQTKLERALGQKKAIIYQGLLFMLFHIPVNIFEFSLTGNVIRFISNFEFQLFNGVILGLIYMKTRNIWMSVTCHYLYNWFGAIVSLFL